MFESQLVKMSNVITFDKESNIWSVFREDDSILDESESMGATILRNLAAFPAERILEYHYESSVYLSASKILMKSKLCALNLMRAGIEKGDIVIIFSQVNESVTPLIIACLLIGAIFNTFETNFSDEDTEYALNLLQPKAIFYDKTFLSRISHSFNTSSLKLFLSFDNSSNSVSNVLFESNENYFNPMKFDCAVSKIAACIIFTSGTTGHPKGVLVSQSLLRHGVLSWWSINQEDTLFVASPLRWISHLSLLFLPLFKGCLRIASNSSANPEYFCKIIKEHKVTQFFVVAGLLSQILNSSENNLPGCLDSLKGVACGGEFVSLKIRKDLENIIPHCKLICVYGMSEVGGVVAHNEFLDDENINGGYLLPGFEFKVVDHNYNSLSPGEKGILFLRYKEGFLKYFKNEIQNDESFTDDNWYNTEDYAKIVENGMIEVFGRYKDNIWCNGHLIIPSLVEQAINEHHLVSTSCIVGIPHADRDKGQMAAAAIKLKNHRIKNILEENEIKRDILEFLIRRISPQAMPSGGIHLMESFPQTTCGKVDKSKLAKQIVNK